MLWNNLDQKAHCTLFLSLAAKPNIHFVETWCIHVWFVRFHCSKQEHHQLHWDIQQPHQSVPYYFRQNQLRSKFPRFQSKTKRKCSITDYCTAVITHAIKCTTWKTQGKLYAPQINICEQLHQTGKESYNTVVMDTTGNFRETATFQTLLMKMIKKLTSEVSTFNCCLLSG